jgi:hypothetical protein
MIIVSKLLHSEKVAELIALSREFGSNVTVHRFSQAKKHPEPKNSTEGGIVIERRLLQQEKAFGSMVASLDSASNVTGFKLWQAEKQHPCIAVTLLGMVML